MPEGAADLMGSPAPGSPSVAAIATCSLTERLQPVIERLECERQSASRLSGRRIRLSLWILAATFVIPPGGLIALAAIRLGYGYLSIELLKLFLLPIPVVIVLGLILAFWANQPILQFGAAYKANILPAVAEAAGGFRYEPDGQIPMERLEPSTLVPAHQIYESEDLFRGRYKGVEIDLAEAELADIVITTDQKGRTTVRRVVLFSGLFALFSMDKRFSGRTVVRTDIGALLNWVFDGHEGLERVRLEESTFEETFEVYSSDQIEARYLLTPAFMERLASLANRFGHRSLQAAFYDRQLLLMVPLDADRFEPPAISKSLHEDNGIARLTGELAEVLAIVDTLKLDQQTGL